MTASSRNTLVIASATPLQIRPASAMPREDEEYLPLFIWLLAMKPKIKPRMPRNPPQQQQSPQTETMPMTMDVMAKPLGGAALEA